ncbi:MULTISPECIES: response regulator transcription factor [Variovorax]|jgi:DNA-binding NarL/FixJ family response regulator|uniref:response regulator transcription factor n=1 Tax=Variovorax TaxID=34072 RepID=UPI0008C2DAE8|nr:MULTISPECIES: response regulator transcription factor [Variovorax]UVH61058.1 response regulator transcription factor [Variovorax paradoxus]SES99653.1 two component transcriptional regulator, LuxR family [Variovorax sp. OV084]
MTAETQVALVEDDTGMRERISRVVDADPSLSLAYSASNAADILGWLVDNPIDVLLVDLGLPDRPGLQVISQCRNMQPACAVMVLSIFGDEANMVQAFEAGASGYLLKDGTEADLATHIRHLRAGGSPMSPVIARKLLRRWQAHSGGAPRQQQPAAAKPASTAPSASAIAPERLSPREFEVLDLVSRGFTYVEVGTQMGVSASTVQTHIRNIYGKLDVHNKSEAVFEARNLGWLP